GLQRLRPVLLGTGVSDSPDSLLVARSARIPPGARRRDRDPDGGRPARREGWVWEVDRRSRKPRLRPSVRRRRLCRRHARAFTACPESLQLGQARARTCPWLFTRLAPFALEHRDRKSTRLNS